MAAIDPLLHPPMERTSSQFPAPSPDQVRIPLPHTVLPPFILALGIIQFCVQIRSLLRGVEFVVTRLTIDDTYYYLETAWNTAAVGFPTFDGIHPTNGVQLLWFWLVWLIALLTPTRTWFLFAVLTVCAGMNALCLRAIWSLGKVLQKPAFSVIAAVLWSLTITGSTTYMMGMENSLHALVFWFVLRHVARCMVAAERGEQVGLVWLTLLLVVSIWTRIDTALFAIVLCAVGVGWLAYHARTSSLFIQRYGASLVRAGGVVLAGALIQMGAFWLMGGSVLPVSTLIKMDQPRPDVGLPIFLAWGGETIPRPPIFPFLVMLVVVLVARSHYRDHTHLLFPIFPLLRNNKAMILIWLALLVGSMLFIVLVLCSFPHAYWSWYIAPIHIFWVITFSLAITAFLPPLSAFATKRPGLPSASWSPLASP